MASEGQTEAKIDFNEAKKSLPLIGEDKDQNIYPRVEICTWIHRIQRRGSENEKELSKKLINYIISNDLVYLYKYVSEKGIMPLDEEKFQAMLQKDVKVRELLEKLILQKDEYEESCNFEIINYYANYLSYIGDKEAALKFLEDTREKCISNVQKIENNLHKCRIGFFYNDRNLVRESLELIDELINVTGDWHLKNITYAYTALNNLWNRDIKGASSNFLSCVSSFSSFDLMSLTTFCSYTAITNLLVLSREKFYQKIICGSEVQEGLYNCPIVLQLTEAFYTCNYGEFTSNLKLLVEEMRNDPFCFEHADYLCREFRLKSYKQLLASFKSLTLTYLSQVFGLTKEFIENDIASFIARGQLDCKINLVQEMVMVSLHDERRKDFGSFLEESNRLMANIQFMERTVNE